MYKFLLGLCLLMFSLTSFSQTAEILITTRGEYIYPDNVMFAYSSKRQLVLNLNNNILRITNPMGVDYAPVQIITLDGRVFNFIVKSIPGDLKKQREIRKNRTKVQEKKITKITYSKRYEILKRKEKGPFRTVRLRDLNRLTLESKINADSSFFANFSYNELENPQDKQYYHTYYFRLKHKNVFAEYGLMNLKKYNIMSLRGDDGSVIGARAGYESDFFKVAAFKGKNFNQYRERNSIDEFDLQNFALFLQYRQQELGFTYSQNLTTEQNIFSVESYNSFNKFTFRGNHSTYSNNEGSSNSYSLNIQYNNNSKGVMNLRNVTLANTVLNSSNNIVLGESNSLTSDMWMLSSVFNLYAQREHDLNLTLSGTSFNTNVSESFQLRSTLNYRFKVYSVNLSYSEHESKSSIFNDDVNKYRTISPSISLLLSPSDANRMQNISVGTHFNSNENTDSKSNIFYLRYSNNSVYDNHSLSLNRHTLENRDALDVKNQYSIGYSYGRKFDNFSIGASFGYVFSNHRSQEINKYLSDTYSYRAYSTYNLRPNHSFSLSAGETLSLRRDPNIKNQDIKFNYVFRYGTESQTPVAKLFNYRSFKAHVFSDNNFNGKFDEGDVLLTNKKVILKNVNGDVVATQNTDKSGYVSFSWLDKATFRIEVENSNFYDSRQAWAKLEDSSLTTELAIADSRSVSLKTYDESLQSFETGIQYNIKCPSANYDGNFSSFSESSIIATIPNVECFATPLFVNYKNNFVPVSVDTVPIVKGEVIFKIRKVNEVDIFLLEKNKKEELVPLSAKGQYAQVGQKKYYYNGESVSFELPLEAKSYNLEEIIKGPYSCVFQENDKMLFFDKKQSKKVQLFYVCKKK